MTTPTDEAIAAAIKSGCDAAEVHVGCSYPACNCKQIPAAVRAALSAIHQPSAAGPVPDRWVMLPGDLTLDIFERVREFWAAGLAAAPTPPGTVPEDGNAKLRHLLSEIEDALDRDTYAQKLRDGVSAPDDADYCIKAGTVRKLTNLIDELDQMLSTAPTPPAASQPSDEELREVLAEEEERSGFGSNADFIRQRANPARVHVSVALAAMRRVARAARTKEAGE